MLTLIGFEKIQLVFSSLFKGSQLGSVRHGKFPAWFSMARLAKFQLEGITTNCPLFFQFPAKYQQEIKYFIGYSEDKIS